MAKAAVARVTKHISEVRRDAILSRWESVQQEQKEWLMPFHELPLARAMAYLEDLRKITELAGAIINQRIGNEYRLMKCAGPHCGKDMSGTLSNGRPKWIAKKDLKDKNNPEIIHSLYFCSEICHNLWVRQQQGAMGGDGR